VRCVDVAAWVAVGVVAAGDGQNGGYVELAVEEQGPQDGNAGNSCEQNCNVFLPLMLYFRRQNELQQICPPFLG